MAKRNTKDGLRSKRELLVRMDQLIVEAVEYRAAIAALKEEVGAKDKRIRMLEDDLYALIGKGGRACDEQDSRGYGCL